jgi:cell division transport system permease protein
MSRLAYFGRETAISLRRNLLMTIAGIITVMISLLLFGGILLVQRTVDHGTSKWRQGVELEIFMKVDAPQSEVDAMRGQLEANTAEIKHVRYLNHDDAYKEFKKLFKDQPALIETTTPDALPQSFRVSLVDAELTEQVTNKYENSPGVDVIESAQEQTKRLLNVIRVIRLLFFSMAGALLASSLFLIVNTIRLATFARRREIEVMKLVGASNWFVRVPFMAEGLVQGVIGAGFAFGLIYALKVVIANFLGNRRDLFNTFTITSSDAVGIGILVLVIGAAIGTIGSAIGLRRFIEA